MYKLLASQGREDSTSGLECEKFETFQEMIARFTLLSLSRECVLVYRESAEKGSDQEKKKIEAAKKAQDDWELTDAEIICYYRKSQGVTMFNKDLGVQQ